MTIDTLLADTQKKVNAAKDTVKTDSYKEFEKRYRKSPREYGTSGQNSRRRYRARR